MRIIIVQKITNDNNIDNDNDDDDDNNNNNNNLYETRVCPLFLILHETSSYCINQVAELLIFIELINSVSF